MGGGNYISVSKSWTAVPLSGSNSAIFPSCTAAKIRS
jgi:hypothetical protein